MFALSIVDRQKKWRCTSPGSLELTRPGRDLVTTRRTSGSPPLPCGGPVGRCTYGWSSPCLLGYCSAGPWVAAYIFQREYCAACEATPPQCPVHVPHRIGPTVTVRSGRAPNPTTKGVLPGSRAQEQLIHRGNSASAICRRLLKSHRPCAKKVVGEIPV